MPWRYTEPGTPDGPRLPMRGPSLLDRTRGACAERIQQHLDVSTAGRVTQLEAEVKALRRMLAMDIRMPLGLQVADARHLVNFNPATRRIRVYSDGDSIATERNPNLAPDTLDVTTDACMAAIATVKDCADATCTLTDCGGTLTFIEGAHVALKQAAGGANECALEPLASFKTCALPDSNPGSWEAGPPTGYLRIPYSENGPCADDAVEVAVPYWTCLG